MNVPTTRPRTVEDYSYDIAFSYAGEDREYVERVASVVERHARVFYDRHEQIDLWGKDLHAHLAEVFGQRSRFCVMFISRHYARKVWTNHERESALARALQEQGTYLLPARFDDTPVPGLLPAIGHVDLRTLTPEEFGAMLLKKVRISRRARPPRARSRLWMAAAPAVLGGGLVLGWVGFGGISRAADHRGAGSAGGEQRGAPSHAATHSENLAIQEVQADGAGSTAFVDGGMRMKRRAGGSSRQEVSAKNGGTAVVGGMVFEEISDGAGASAKP